MLTLSEKLVQDGRLRRGSSRVRLTDYCEERLQKEGEFDFTILDCSHIKIENARTDETIDALAQCFSFYKQEYERKLICTDKCKYGSAIWHYSIDKGKKRPMEWTRESIRSMIWDAYSAMWK